MGMGRFKWMTRRRFFAGLAAGSAGLAAQALAVEPGWLQVRRVRLAALSGAGCRLVQISDIHHKGDVDLFRKVVSTVNGLKPDVVLFTGDLVEESAFWEEALELLGGIKAPLFGIPGNHDYWAEVDFAPAMELCARGGGAWLMDGRAEALEGKLEVWGVTGAARPVFTPRTGAFRLLLSHYPNWVEHIPDESFDLILAGHSHGGQVRLPGIGACVVPFGVGQFERGLYLTPSGPLYVNVGIGYFYVNARLFCRPEITVFDA